MIKLFGLEIECDGRFFFASLSGVGEVWFERRSRRRGRQWADYERDPGTLSVYLGSTYLVFCSPSAGAMA
ncbi:hypothetical protein [Methylobacterium sp. WL120]|uniref:hypothetical protein n=1 Tax=Methylobacterium sp. WL120 TaxID=2603887 RepID=UPI0011CC7CFF|nr:hypothetical protein [Methylobacterium sp. WL120]TXM69100.1 hypothetical protein FV229_06215 [Methylobacterium sp. WL120]